MSEENAKFTLFSEEEYQRIICLACKPESGASEAEIKKVIDWCDNTQSAYLLMRAFLTGAVEIVKYDENGEPLFSPAAETTKETNARG